MSRILIIEIRVHFASACLPGLLATLTLPRACNFQMSEWNGGIALLVC